MEIKQILALSGLLSTLIPLFHTWHQLIIVKKLDELGAHYAKNKVEKIINGWSYWKSILILIGIICGFLNDFLF